MAKKKAKRDHKLPKEMVKGSVVISYYSYSTPKKDVARFRNPGGETYRVEGKPNEPGMKALWRKAIRDKAIIG